MMTFNKQKSAGFTLLEVMVTVAILAILAVFAVSSYRHYIVKARLQEGQSALSENYLYLEKMYSKYNGYGPKASVTPGSPPVFTPITTADLPRPSTGSGAAGYDITVNSTCAADDNRTAAATFCLKATPRSGQENASGGGKECGVLTVDQSGKYVATADPNNDYKCFK